MIRVHIERGIAQGIISDANPSSAANTGMQESLKNEAAILRDVVQFCFQGLGIEYNLWNSCLEKVVAENQEGGPVYEGL